MCLHTFYSPQVSESLQLIASVGIRDSAAVKSFGAAPTVRVTSTESAYFCHRQDKVVVPTTLRKWFLRRQTFLLSINICFLTRNTRKTYSRRSFVVKSCEKWTVTVVASSRLYLWFQSRTSTWVRPVVLATKMILLFKMKLFVRHLE